MSSGANVARVGIRDVASCGESRRAQPHHIRRTILFVIGITALVAVTANGTMHDAIDSLIRIGASIIDAHPTIGLFVFVILSALSAMLFFFSSSVLIPVAVYTWGRAATMSLLWIGWLAGGALSYLVGRYPGRHLLHWIVRPKTVRVYERKVSSRASLALVVLLQIALPSEVPGYLLGSVRYPFRRYAIVLALAELPYGIGAVYLGDSFVRGQAWIFALVAAVAASVSVGALILLNRKLEQEAVKE